MFYVAKTLPFYAFLGIDICDIYKTHVHDMRGICMTYVHLHSLTGLLHDVHKVSNQLLQSTTWRYILLAWCQHTSAQYLA